MFRSLGNAGCHRAMRRWSKHEARGKQGLDGRMQQLLRPFIKGRRQGSCGFA